MMVKDIGWLKEIVKEEHEHYSNDHDMRATAYEYVLDLIDQVERPALPTVPEFVAEDYEVLQTYSGVDLAALNYWTRNSALQCTKESYEWLLDQDIETIASLLCGQFTVEEKKYLVKLPMLKGDGECAYVDVLGQIWVDSYPNNRYHLTESEINNIDPRYMAFANEVHE